MRYKNKVDIWIGAIIIGTVVMYIPLFFVVPEDEMWILVLSMGVTALIVLPFFYGYTELGDEELKVQLSVFRYRIKYENIKSIRKCKNFLSSLAMTSTRIEIKEHNKSYIRGTTFIGPKDRDDVFYELQRRCRNLEESA